MNIRPSVSHNEEGSLRHGLSVGSSTGDSRPASQGTCLRLHHEVRGRHHFLHLAGHGPSHAFRLTSSLVERCAGLAVPSLLGPLAGNTPVELSPKLSAEIVRAG